MKYVIIKKKDLENKQIELNGYEKSSAVSIEETEWAIVKLKDEYATGFKNSRKFDKEQIKELKQKVIEGTIEDAEVYYRVQDLDATGRVITRTAATQKGWRTELQAIEAKTSSDWFYHKDQNQNDLNITSVTMYDEQGQVTSQEFQAVKTVVRWAPSFDYEIIGGKITQEEKPMTDVRFWILGAPAFGGVAFSQGGVNLKKIGEHNEVSVDGRAAKYMPYIEGLGVNVFDFVFTHQKGYQHDIQIFLELYRK